MEKDMKVSCCVITVIFIGITVVALAGGHGWDTRRHHTMCKSFQPQNNVLMRWTPLCFQKARDEQCTSEFQIAVHDTKDIVSLSYIFPGDAPWEWPEIENILHVLRLQKEKLKRDVVFVDIGANIGSISLQVAARGVPTIAIEPMPHNLDLLKSSLCHPANVAIAKRITLIETGLSDTARNCSIWSHLNNRGNGQIVCDSDAAPAQCPECVRMSDVPVTTLDALFADYDHERFPIGAVKIDVECFEPLVMKGGKRLFTSGLVPFIVLEFTGSVIEDRTGVSPLAFLQMLDEWNYDIYLKSFDRLPLHPQNFAANAQKVFNIYLVRRPDL